MSKPYIKYPRKMVCALCKRQWTETSRQHGCCPGCGASMHEIVWAYSRRETKDE